MIKIDESIINGTSGSDSGMGRKMPPITEEEQEILEHQGILGMKWGKRKGKSKGKNDSSLSSTVPMTKNAKRLDEGIREKQFINEYNSRDKMSTRSLQNRVKRLQAEQQFRDLVNKPAAERAAAAAKIAEKKAKRNKMIMRTALSIYGNVPIASIGKKGKEYADILGPSQALAKAAAGSIKNSDDISGSLLHAKHKSKLDKRSNMLYEEDVILHGSKIVDSEGLLHYGVAGMHWGTKKGRAIEKVAGRTEGVGLARGAASYAKSLGNTVAHPLISTSTRLKNLKRHPILSATSAATMMKKNNQEIRSEVLKKKMMRSAEANRRTGIKTAKNNLKTAKKLASISKKSGDKDYLKKVKDVNAKKSIVKSAKNNYEGVFNARNKGSDVVSSKGFKDAKKELKAERLQSKQKVQDQKLANSKIINRSKKSISKK
mgnify:FL=1